MAEWSNASVRLFTAMEAWARISYHSYSSFDKNQWLDNDAQSAKR